tara:strand:- start:197 stop:436 length:240 start_codon:yes stop_codon:yes gene_type:complete
MKLDYFTMRYVKRPKERWRKNKNDWYMKSLPPHLAYDLENMVKGKKCYNPDCKRFKHMGGCDEDTWWIAELKRRVKILS